MYKGEPTALQIKALKMAYAALDKQISANVDIRGEEDDIYMYCPRCDNDIYDLHECGFDYCPYCGQVITWPAQIVN